MGRQRTTYPTVAIFTETDIAGGKALSTALWALTAAWQAAGLHMAPPYPRGCREECSYRLGAKESQRWPFRSSTQAPWCHDALTTLQGSLIFAVKKVRVELTTLSVQGVICIIGSMHAVGAALRQLDLDSS
ncbi:hypothetical protein N2152v2_010490 [Parachlorella kessleri]